jgi:hypothetical protein
MGDIPGTVVCLYGQAEYNSQGEAENEVSPPLVPPNFPRAALFIGRLTFQKSAATAANIASPFLQPLAGSATTVTSHNNLTGLQGGAAGEYYHLTAAQVGSLPADFSVFLKTDGSNSMQGNLNFVGAGRKITADFSNGGATGLLLQSNVTNGNTVVRAVPNGTSTTSALSLRNSSDPSNFNYADYAITANSLQIVAGKTGTAPYVPISFVAGGVEPLRLAINGYVGVGTIDPKFKLQVQETTDGIVTLSVANGKAVLGQDSYAALQLGYPTGGGVRIVGAQKPADAFAGRLEFQYATGLSTFNTAVTISETGNVGISAIPAYKLDVGGDIRTTGVLRVEAANIFLGTGALSSTRMFFNTSAGSRSIFTDTNNRMYFLTSAGGTALVSYDNGDLYCAGQLLPGTQGNLNTSGWKKSIQVPAAGAIWWETSTKRKGISCTTDNNIYFIASNLDGTSPTSPFVFAMDTGVASATNWVATSDVRLKYSIHDRYLSLDQLLQVQPKGWNNLMDKSKSAGVIAQQLQQILPELVPTGQDGYLRVNEGKAALVMVASLAKLFAEFLDEYRRNQRS